MDSPLVPSWGAMPWSGVARVEGPILQLMAHGQRVGWQGRDLPSGSMIAIYDAQVLHEGHHYSLAEGMGTKVVHIPEYEAGDMSGIGGIGMAAKHLGMKCMALMDSNKMVCDTLHANGHINIIHGDVLQARDRHLLHECRQARRGWLFSGFPCQPLSTQGDQRGASDERSKVFMAVVKTAWEQQMRGLLLECVPAALTAPFVQEALQRLSWSLGMDIHQQILHLQNVWPNRRSRWWAILVPREYQLGQLGMLKIQEDFQMLQSIFARWPIWNDAEEKELEVSDIELDMFHSHAYGDDLRLLQTNQLVPCLLHSYGAVLQDCPCGCRKALSRQRLLKDGMRGFYVMSKEGKPRYLHVAEAAYICSIPPSTSFPHGPRKSLCLVGQCAAPIQGLWMLCHFMYGVGINPYGNAVQALQQYQQLLMRDAHSSFRFDAEPFMMDVHMEAMEVPKHIKIVPGETVESLCKAESKFLEPGVSISLCDGQGLLGRNANLQAAPLMGHFRLICKKKKQCKDVENGVIQLNFTIIQDHQAQVIGGYFLAGIFIFEAMNALNLPRKHYFMHDAHGERVGLDSRAWSSMTLMYVDNIQAEGVHPVSTPVGGLSDLCLDMAATVIIKQTDNVRSCFWMPSALATAWFRSDSDDHWLDHWALSILHGRLFLGIAVQRHWILLEVFVKDGILQVYYMDGQEHDTQPVILRFAARLGALLKIAPVGVTRRQTFDQICCQTCGTIALLHLGERLGLWSEECHPDEMNWHILLLRMFPGGWLTAEGKGGNMDDRDVVWMLRDVLREHGVLDDRTEERAKAAVDKIGAQRLREALQSRNVWPALKALGSLPRVNFMFVKPDELEKQIRQRAQSKFRVQTADKKNKVYRAKLDSSDVDPALLQLIPDTFVLQNEEGEVHQLKMEDVATHRAGLAFGRVGDVLPFIREGKSLSLDGLAVLTTSRIPPSEQGLLPVMNLRFPLLYVPTQEPILLEGSLVNLGDLTVIRKLETELIETTAIGTSVLKLTQYKDEWTEDWSAVLKSPLKTILQMHPLFTVCSGQRCGGNCQRYHAPVDVEIDAVVLDVWARFLADDAWEKGDFGGC